MRNIEWLAYKHSILLFLPWHSLSFGRNADVRFTPQKRTCGAASGYGNSRLSAEATHLPRRSIICETRSFDQYRERRGPAPVSLCASNRCPRVRRLSAVQSSAEACRRRQLPGATPTPGIASRTSPGKSSRCQPSTTNNSPAAHDIDRPYDRWRQAR